MNSGPAHHLPIALDRHRNPRGRAGSLAADKRVVTASVPLCFGSSLPSGLASRAEPHVPRPLKAIDRPCHWVPCSASYRCRSSAPRSPRSHGRRPAPTRMPQVFVQPSPSRSIRTTCTIAAHLSAEPYQRPADQSGGSHVVRVFTLIDMSRSDRLPLTTAEHLDLDPECSRWRAACVGACILKPRRCRCHTRGNGTPMATEDTPYAMS